MPSTTPANTAGPQPTPVRNAGAVVAFVAYLAGGITGVAGFTDNAELAMWAGLAFFICGGLTTILIPKLEGKVSPTSQVVQQYNGSGQVILGPAAVDTIDDDQLGHAEATGAGDDEPGDHRPEVVGTDGEPYYEQP